MPGGYKKIGPNDGKKTRFEKGRVTNPWGRPRKLVSQILMDMKEDGVEAVTAGQVADVISVLLNYPVESVKKMAQDSKLPIIVQRTARRFAGASDKDWDTVIRENLDRAHGKSINRHEVAGKGGGAIKFDYERLSVEELRQLSKIRKKATANGDNARNAPDAI